MYSGRHNGLQDQENEDVAQGNPPLLPPPDPIPSDYYEKLFNMPFVSPSASRASSVASFAFPTISKATIGFARQPNASRIPSMVALSGIYDNDDDIVSQISQMSQMSTPRRRSTKPAAATTIAAPVTNRYDNLRNIDMSIPMGFPPGGLQRLANMNLDPTRPSLIKSIPERGGSIQQSFKPFSGKGESYPKMGGLVGIGGPMQFPNSRTSGSTRPWPNLEMPNDEPKRPSDISNVYEMEGARGSVQPERGSFQQGYNTFQAGRPSVQPGRPSLQAGRPSLQAGRPSLQQGRPSLQQGRNSVGIGGENRPGGIPEEINIPSDITTDVGSFSTVSDIEGF